MEKENHGLVDEILEFLWMENPVEATLAGIHRYDDRLEKLDLVSRRNKLQRKREYAEMIAALQKKGGSTVELNLLRSALEVGVTMEERSRSLDRDAGTYPRLALYGIYQLVARSSAPYHYRALRAVDRLREIPRILAEGKLNLSYGENIPSILTLGGVELAATGRDYLSQLVGLLVGEVPELENVIKKYADHALKAFEDYLEFLVEEIQPRSNGASGVGGELFEYLLSREHNLDLDTAELRRIALEELEKAEAELESRGKRAAGSGSWRDKLDLEESAIPVGDLLAHWQGVVDEVRQAVRKADLLSLPSGGKLELVETPPFERLTIPLAGYIEAPLFEENSRAFFCITPPRAVAPGSENGTGLARHSRFKALVTVLRDLYPGRHTLLQRRRRAGIRLAYLAQGNVLEEGWCNYVLSMAAEHDLFEEPRLSLFALRDRLLAAWRVRIDLDLHTEGFKESEAVSRLAAGAGIDEQQAWNQVQRLAAAPTSSVGALIGRLKIESWRESCCVRAKKPLSLKKFHDSLLHLSGLPLETVEKRLLKAASATKR
ncbi:MAG: hypothetical protein A3F83_00550 [Candidatus Glassbacteria bacterium RIFCSPLOWO2_12_FULL_58_11]|uniref:DUF885 domain-containing protein n=2 Tax=Candidatus Glassiibacteriota TaxID=1817805 RepID=A0A1F5YPT9_9BACT|nr:MAG: hypothetical protein A2Z86_11975 [Candidatus Glassbacteria bacterium GWA2_58_10]OGG02125.1 MAG: hypothetical protein A3F83_00550 [Candidatus Glassbacteria bacterium RIFCSPLOWO2_12_FULL_58_11]